MQIQFDIVAVFCYNADFLACYIICYVKGLVHGEQLNVVQIGNERRVDVFIELQSNILQDAFETFRLYAGNRQGCHAFGLG